MNSKLKPLPRILAGGKIFYVYSEHNEMPKDVHALHKPLEIGFLFSPEAAMNHLFFDTYPAYFGVKHNLLYGSIKINENGLVLRPQTAINCSMSSGNHSRQSKFYHSYFFYRFIREFFFLKKTFQVLIEFVETVICEIFEGANCRREKL